MLLVVREGPLTHGALYDSHDLDEANFAFEM